MMKKVLLGTTAVLGAGLVASPAFAADGVKLSVGGFFKEAYQVVIDDDGEGEIGNDRNADGFFNDAEIHFKGSTVLDNGLEVGARIELEGETAGDQIDEAWVSFAGGFGEIHIGSEDDALANSCIVPPGGTGNFSAFSPNQFGANVGDLSSLFGASTNTVCSGVDDRGDAQKILYVSPSFGGFQLSASYTPNGGDERHIDVGGPHLGMPIHEDNESSHNFALYATYSYEGEGWGLTWGGGASIEGTVEKVDGPDRKTQEFFQTGLNLSFGNLSVGGAFEFLGDALAIDGADNDIWVAGGGIAYNVDPFTVGMQYSHQDSDFDIAGGGDFDFSMDRVVLTGEYALGPGIKVDGELGYTWLDTDPELAGGVDDYDAFEIGIGTNITF